MNALAFIHLLDSLGATLIRATATLAAVFPSQQEADHAEALLRLHRLRYVRPDPTTFITHSL